MSKSITVDDRAKYKMKNELVNARYKLGTVEQKMVIALAAHITKDAKHFEQCSVSAKDLASFMGLDAKSAYRQIKKAADALVKSSLSFEWYKDDKATKKSWMKASWFDYIYYDAETVTLNFRFGSVIEPMLLELVKGYVESEAKPTMKFKHNASYRFYNFAVEWHGIKPNEPHTVSFDDLRKMLEMEDLYKQFGGFNQKILKPSINEINKLTDYHMDYKQDKAGRRVTDITFFVRCKASASKSNRKKQIVTIDADATPTEWSDEQKALYDELVGYGLTKKAAKEFINTKPLEDIRISVDYTLAQQKAGKIKALSKYMYSAIAEGYGVADARAAAQEEAAATAKEAERIAAMTPKQLEAYNKKQDDIAQAQEMAQASSDFVAKAKSEEETKDYFAKIRDMMRQNNYQ